MQWYAVHTKPRQEVRASVQLANQGFEVFAPRLRERRRRQSRLEWVVGPLFPRYVFIRADAQQQSLASVRSTLGCSDLVRCGFAPIVVPNAVIDALQARQNDGVIALPEPQRDWAAGTALDVIGGPFEGMRVLFQQRSGAGRVRVLLELMGQQRSTVMEADWLSPA